MTSLGEALRLERLRRNLDFEQIYRETKISPKILQSIEAERFDKLPGGVFTKSFVRQYARFLELDEEEIVSELKKILEPPEPAVAPAGSPIPLPRVPQWQRLSDRGPSDSSFSSLAAFALVVAVMLVCSGIYAWWQTTRHPSPLGPETVASEPAPQPSQPAPAPAVLGRAPEAPAPESVGQPKAESTNPEQAADREALSVQAAAAASSSGNPAASVRVGLTAEEPTWVGAWSDGKRVFFDTLQPKQTKTLEATDKLRLLVGNAGGLEISLNGKPLGPVGRKGQVCVVQLTPKGFQIIPRNPLPPDSL